jgi:hypothetical protein
MVLFPTAPGIFIRGFSVQAGYSGQRGNSSGEFSGELSVVGRELPTRLAGTCQVSPRVIYFIPSAKHDGQYQLDGSYLLDPFHRPPSLDYTYSGILPPLIIADFNNIPSVSSI